ncbi:MAG: hypothetical protein AB7F88_01335 [Pyrinomonadaceae bacterium]
MLRSRFAWVMSIATFALSVLLTSVLVLRSELPAIEVDYANFQRDENVILTGQIEIESAIVKLGSDPNEATFRIRNLTDGTIYYPGYERNHNALVWIRQNGKIQDALDLPCWMGIETQSLEPTQEAYFSVPVPKNGKPYRVGFDFRIDTRAGWKTVWVWSSKPLL